MTATDTKVRTSTKTNEQTPPTRHVYHAICNSNQNPRIAYCGHKGGGAAGDNWYIETAKSIDCTLCIMGREEHGCPRCGHKPKK
jgi:hypothetical protein